MAEIMSGEVVAAVKAGSAERAAEPESQPLPKLPRGERKLLVASLTEKGVAAEPPAAEDATAEAKPQLGEGTRQATLIAMLRRPEGADLDAIAEATGWQNHSIRGAISGALEKKLGLEVTSTKDGQGRRIHKLA